MQRGDSERRRGKYGQALAINPQFADLHFQYGRACRLAGDPAAARAAFEQALAINPRYARARSVPRPDPLRRRAARKPLWRKMQEAARLDPGYRTADAG